MKFVDERKPIELGQVENTSNEPKAWAVYRSITSEDIRYICLISGPEYLMFNENGYHIDSWDPKRYILISETCDVVFPSQEGEG